MTFFGLQLHPQYTTWDEMREAETLGRRAIQKRVPILVGGGGEQVTLKITARYADWWHGFGTPEIFKHKLEVLKKHCADVVRDYNEIAPTGGGGILIRDDRNTADKRLPGMAARASGKGGRTWSDALLVRTWPLVVAVALFAALPVLVLGQASENDTRARLVAAQVDSAARAADAVKTSSSDRLEAVRQTLA